VALGAIVSPALAHEVSTLNANVRVAHIAGAGHSIRREQLAPYVQAVRDLWLKYTLDSRYWVLDTQSYLLSSIQYPISTILIQF